MKGIELFARTTADGWDCWGNEVFDAREAARQRRRKKVNQLFIMFVPRTVGKRLNRFKYILIMRYS